MDKLITKAVNNNNNNDDVDGFPLSRLDLNYKKASLREYSA
jgi:hypothetical protein